MALSRVDYLLACLGEECGETQQLVGKGLRFGLDSFRPTDPTQNTLDMLKGEAHDIMSVYFMLCEELGVNTYIDDNLLKAKREKVNKYYYEHLDKDYEK